MTEAQILERIYPSVVTFLGNWRQMIKDVKRLKLTTISLFLTGVAINDRKKIYQLLEATSVKTIPHIHARHDMKEWELDYLASRFKTKVITIHYQHLKNLKNSKHLKKFFIENNDHKSRIRNFNTLKKCGGVCIDLSHFQYYKNIGSKQYEISRQLVAGFKVGCNHLSAILPNGFSHHYAANAAQLDYVAKIPRKYFSRYINIELANSIPEQLKFKKYVAKLLAKS